MDNQPTYSPEQIKQAQHQLGLSDRQLAFVLGFKDQQSVRRIKVTNTSAGSFRAIAPAQARLLRSYLEGYRPDDWPV